MTIGNKIIGTCAILVGLTIAQEISSLLDIRHMESALQESVSEVAASSQFEKGQSGSDTKFRASLQGHFDEAASTAYWWVWSFLGFSVVCGALGVYILVRHMNAALNQSLDEIKEGADQVAGAASQVASASQALAQGASQQAGSLEETSASTNEISSITRKNADNSKLAAEAMERANSKVTEANRTLDDMVASMGQINESSQKISKIIKVIDEIAFQTNILALNAAVEAARAGEAGMGFAVVADEVRNLAQRSAQAAKDTASLIEESVIKSTAGSAKLNNVAEAILGITQESVQVKTLVDEVTAASHEQSKGMDQIAKAVVEMEQITQRNAASSEESASASEELSAQAEQMKTVVHRLRTMIDAGAANTVTTTGASPASGRVRASLTTLKRAVTLRPAAPAPTVKKTDPEESIPFGDDDAFKAF